MAKTKITLEIDWDDDGVNKKESRIYSVEFSEAYMNIYELKDNLIIPLLRAAKFADESISRLFNYDD